MKCTNTIVLAALGYLCVCRVLAQNTATREAFAREPHTGPIETALVGVTTRFTDKRSQVVEERHGCGMALRCDGFILFSAAMLDHRANEPDDLHPSIEITLYPGTPQERNVPAPWPRSVPVKPSLRVVKIDDVHIPAIRTLLPDKLRTGDILTVVWQPWDQDSHRFGPIQRGELRYASPAKADRDPWIEGFDQAPEGVPPGAVVVGPEGMAVGMLAKRADEDAREFISMECLAKLTNCVAPVPTTDGEFAALKKVEAVVAADVVQPDAVDGAVPQEIPNPDQTSGDSSVPRGRMVKISGGPVVLPKAIHDTQLDMEKSTIACVPPFEIDCYEVTNKEYWEFWSHLPNKTSAEQAFRRLSWPAAWSNSPVPFPPTLDRLPVLGVPMAGAQAYARSVGKRLPTPYEWTLAALGPLGDANPPAWLAQYMAEKNNVALQLKKEHMAFLQQYPEIHGDDFVLQSTRLHPLTVTKAKIGRQVVTVAADNRIHGSDFMIGLPWVISPLLGFAPELQSGAGFFDGLTGVDNLDIPLRLKMQTWSKQTIDAVTQGLWDKWKAPPYILAVGSRPFDRSPAGVSDMIWNGAELVLPPPTAPGGLNGFAVSVTLQHPQDNRVLDDTLLVSGPNSPGLIENYPSNVAYPLSRLIERTPGFPVAQWLWFQNDLEETRAAMRVVSGWQVNMLPAISTVQIPTDNHSPFVGPVFYDNYPLYRAWVKPSKHTRVEIGNAVALPVEEPLPTPLVPRETGAALRFLIPIGFRCAR